MKSFLDLIQILLHQPQPIKLICCALVFLCLWVLWRYFWALYDLSFKLLGTALKPLPKPTKWNAFLVLFWGGILSLFSVQLENCIQYIEQRFISPVYVTSDTSSFALQCFETELSKNVSPSEMVAIMKWVDKISEDLGSNRLALLEVMNSECGLNPYAFNIQNGNVVACGPIQFTKAGCENLCSFQEVKQACLRKDIEFLMSLTYQYLKRTGGPLNRACDVYTAVFMPSFVGRSDETVLASLNSNRPDFYLQNKGLDGHYLIGDVIMSGKPDGKITINDLHLHLELKKSILLKRYQ